MPATVLLTGCCGLVGRYLLRSLLMRGLSVAVLVRATPQASASQRVEAALEPFEADCYLPRPRIIAGDLNAAGLAMDPHDAQWLAARPLIVLHCAASIRFVADPLSNEPYRTNVDGTRHLLELCRALDVRAFHYVSTAYVGCRSQGQRVLEVLLPDSSPQHNPYEKSKIAAEQLVATWPDLGPRFIHRPSIVVGDSESGFSSTFHGFYAPLKVGQLLVSRAGNLSQLGVGSRSQLGPWLRQQLGLRSDDCKNLVPVDWVAESIVTCLHASFSAHAATQPVQVLHWTNPRPTPCQILQEAIVAALDQAAVPRAPSPELPQTALGTNPGGTASFTVPHEWADEFREQLKVYQSYFNDDPEFDTTHSDRYTRGCPCPVVDLPLLTKLASYALSVNFGWPRPMVSTVPWQPLVARLRGFESRLSAAEQSLSGRFRAAEQLSGTMLRLNLLGPGAPEELDYLYQAARWVLVDGVESDLTAQPGRFSGLYRLTCSMSVLAECLEGKTTLPIAFEKGCCIIEGEPVEGGLSTAQHWLTEARGTNAPAPN